MKELFAKEVLVHPAVLGSCVLSVCVMGASIWYYQSAITPPAVVHAPVDAAAPAAITAEGTVLPSQNPDLYFEAQGRVASVAVSVGQSVAQGQTLATLDTAALSAARDQAEANLHLTQAKLDGLKAGARPVDVSAKETAVAQAEQALSNLYAQVPNDLSSAYSNMLGAVHADTDSLYNGPETNTPTLVFTTSNGQLSTNAAAERVSLNTLLASWPDELGAADPAGLDTQLAASIAHLGELRTYSNLLTQAVGSALTNSTFTASSVTTANADLALLRASIGSSLDVLQADQQQIASAKLATQSAQNALAQTKAPATKEDLEAAEAAVDAAGATLSAAQAALGNAIIAAPFSGTVSAVRVKVGDLASPGLAAISLTPKSALEVDGYLSEADAAAVSVGDQATVTLDAFGAGHPFAATVSSIDHAPTMQQGVPAYKVVLQFAQPDAALSSGMTANLSITPTR